MKNFVMLWLGDFTKKTGDYQSVLGVKVFQVRDLILSHGSETTIFSEPLNFYL